MSRKSPTPSAESKAGDGTEEARGPGKQSRLRSWLREGLILGALVVAVLSARSSFADHYYVPSGSMKPTVLEGDHLVVNKLAYGLRVPFTSMYLLQRQGPERGDVVVLESPTDGTILLKRVIGLPGDVVRIDDGRVFVNGRGMEVRSEDEGLIEVLGERRHAIRLTHNGGGDWGPQTLPDHQYLVMGDNRGESHDGRSFGLVERERILGRAIAIYWRSGLTWTPFDT